LIQCISPDQSDGIAKQAADFITIKKQLLVIHGNTISIAWIFLGGFNLPKQT
jgi:hypothetical protein